MKHAQMTYENIKEEFNKLIKTIEVFDKDFENFNNKKVKLTKLKNKSGLMLSSYLSKFYEIDNAISKKHEEISLEGHSKDIAELAKKGRLAAEEQKKTALSSEKLIQKYVGGIRESMNVLDELVYKFVMIQKESFAMDHDATIIQAEALVDESNKLKESLVEQIEIIKSQSKRLEKVDLSDTGDKVKEDTKAYNDTIANNNKDVNVFFL